MICGGAFKIGVRRETVLSFGNTDREVAVAVLFEFAYLVADFLIGNNIVGTVESGGYGFDFIPNRHIVGVQGGKAGHSTIGKIGDFPSQLLRTGTAIGPVCAFDSFYAISGGNLFNNSDFSICI